MRSCSMAWNECGGSRRTARRKCEQRFGPSRWQGTQYTGKMLVVLAGQR